MKSLSRIHEKLIAQKGQMAAKIDALNDIRNKFPSDVKIIVISGPVYSDVYQKVSRPACKYQSLD